MFSIFKKRHQAVPVDFSNIKTDMHSHLLPGIDDGSPDLEQSFLLKKGLEDLGYQQFIATPHIMWDFYKNTDATIETALATMQYNQPNHQNIRAAAEYFMDDHFEELLKMEQPLRTITGKRVLVEFSFVAPPRELKELLFKMQIQGYEPVLAHPERYNYFAAEKSVFDEFKSMGCLLQMNLLSLTGYYGRIPQELAHYLVESGNVDYVGTDLHHENHLQALRTSKSIMPVVNQLLDSGRLQNALLVL